MFSSMELNATRDVFDFSFLLESDIDPADLEFDVFIEEWTAEGIKVALNFTNPSLISQSKGGDRVLLNFKNPFLFVS